MLKALSAVSLTVVGAIFPAVILTASNSSSDDTKPAHLLINVSVFADATNLTNCCSNASGSGTKYKIRIPFSNIDSVNHSEFEMNDSSNATGNRRKRRSSDSTSSGLVSYSALTQDKKLKAQILFNHARKFLRVGHARYVLNKMKAVDSTGTNSCSSNCGTGCSSAGTTCTGNTDTQVSDRKGDKFWSLLSADVSMFGFTNLTSTTTTKTAASSGSSTKGISGCLKYGFVTSDGTKTSDSNSTCSFFPVCGASGKDCKSACSTPCTPCVQGSTGCCYIPIGTSNDDCDLDSLSTKFGDQIRLVEMSKSTNVVLANACSSTCTAKP